MADSDQLRQAVYLLAGRFYRSSDAPFGVVGSVDLGGVATVRSKHPDVSALLTGYRAQGLPDAQTWPDASAVAAAVLNTTYADLDAARQTRLTSAVAAAVEWITFEVDPDTGFGIA